MSSNDLNKQRNASDPQGLDEILAELMRAVDAGQSIENEEWFTRYPEFADQLHEYFDRHARAEKLFSPLREAVADALHVRCPHCHNAMELLEQATLTDISCPSCGSSFSLVGQQAGQRFPAGATTIGHFELLEQIGIGQFGSVWKAQDTNLHRLVAVKIPRNGQLDEAQTELFLRDARAAAQLKHPNIVSVHEVGKHDDTIFIVSDLILGKTLKEWANDERVTPREAGKLCVKIAKALHHAHQSGVIHRDLKPSNIMMDIHGEPHIVDFGLAKREAGEITMTVEGQILGTPAYMSPEQARGEAHTVTRCADIYSLGVIFFELLTGELPFRGEKRMLIVQLLNDDPPSPRKLNNSVPRDLETIVLKCLAKEPGKRYEDALQLADDLERFLLAQPILARPTGNWERTWRWCRRNPIVASLSTLTILLLAAVAVGYFREANLRRDVELSYGHLEDEQKQSYQLRKDVSTLEKDVDDLIVRRNQLDSSLTDGQRRLKNGEERLYNTYLKLARSAWRVDDVELADFYLDQCPDGQRKTAWHDLKRLCHPQVETFEGRHCVAISEDGKLLAAGGTDNSIKVWLVATGKLLLTLSGHDQNVIAIDFSPDGSTLASGGGRQVILWDLVKGDIRRTLEGHNQPVTDIDFSPDGRLASASSTEAILWDLKTFQVLQSLPGQQYVVFNHDGQLLATGLISEKPNSKPSGIVVLDLQADRDQLQSNATRINGAERNCRPAFHPRENQLAVSAGLDRVEFWDVNSKRFIQRFSGEVRVGCLAYSSDGNRFVYTGTTNSMSLRPETFCAVVWNLITGEKERILPWYSSAVLGAVFSADGRQLVTADGTAIKVWDVTPPPDPTEQILNDILELDVGQYDWPQWGGSRARINTPAGKNIPSDWNIGKRNSRPKLLENRGYPLDGTPEIKTAAQALQWFVTTKVNGQLRNFRLKRSDDSLTAEVVLTTADTCEADVVWKYDMIKELGVFPHNMATCSVITAGSLLFVCTSNGVDGAHLELPSPRSPSFLAIDRDTGKLIWEDNSPGLNIMHSQWASPSYGVFDGQPQVIFPGGDGWVYSFDPQGDGRGGSKLLWKFDGNPKTSKWLSYGRGSRNNIIAFPAIYDGLVYIVMGQDPEHGEGPGHLWCIDPKKRMDVSAELAVDSAGNVIPHRKTQAVDVSIGERAVPNPNSAVVWHYSYHDQNNDGQILFEEAFHRTLGIPVIKDDILYICDLSGLFHCLHAKTGKVYWTHDLMAGCWGSALLVDDKVYIGDEEGKVTVFRHSPQWQGEVISQIDMVDSIYMTPIVANNVLYIATRTTLYAIEEIPKSP